MRYWTTALAALLAAPGAALAQLPPGDDPPPPAAPTDPAPPPAPDPVPVAPRPPPRPPAPPDAAAAGGDAGHRPSAFSVGIGLGYRLPTSLQTPNVTSVRLRLAGGLTFEPRLVLASSTKDVDTGPSMKDSASEIGVGALVRFPLIRRGRADLELLGALDVARQSTAPDEPDMDLSITTISASYGVSVASWISRHWQVSLSAQNAIVTNTRRDEEMGPSTSTVTTSTTIGLIFNPTVSLMVHLYH